jgi:hypothetical protein
VTGLTWDEIASVAVEQSADPDQPVVVQSMDTTFIVYLAKSEGGKLTLWITKDTS